jgi:hypothetical protein
MPRPITGLVSASGITAGVASGVNVVVRDVNVLVVNDVIVVAATPVAAPIVVAIVDQRTQ